MLLCLFPTFTYAHVGVGQDSGFIHGLTHPITGLDHLCAMIAVGLWATQRGGRAIWLVPLTFVAVMALGGFLGMAAIPLPLVEHGIAASVLILGIFIAAAVHLPLVTSTILVALFALLHGHAHGVEMPEAALGLRYGWGFILATVLLHTIGIGLAMLAQRMASAHATRYAGGAILVCGLYLCFT